jgi:hypothetical protein
VGPKGGVNDVEKRKFLILQGLELRPLGRPSCTQSLYRLRYRGSSIKLSLDIIRLLYIQFKVKLRSKLRLKYIISISYFAGIICRSGLVPFKGTSVLTCSKTQ